MKVHTLNFPKAVHNNKKIIISSNNCFIKHIILSLLFASYNLCLLDFDPFIIFKNFLIIFVFKNEFSFLFSSIFNCI